MWASSHWLGNTLFFKNLSCKAFLLIDKSGDSLLTKEGGRPWDRGEDPVCGNTEPLTGNETHSETILVTLSRSRISRAEKVSQARTRGILETSPLQMGRYVQTHSECQPLKSLKCDAEGYGQIHYPTESDNSSPFVQDIPSLKTGSPSSLEAPLCWQTETGQLVALSSA